MRRADNKEAEFGELRSVMQRRTAATLRTWLDITAVLSAVLCLLLALVWIRSYRHQDNIGWGLWGHDAANRANQERWFVGVEGSQGVLAAGALREREGEEIRGEFVRSGAGFFWNYYGWPLNMFIGDASELMGFGFLRLNYVPTPGYLGHHGFVITASFWAAVLVCGILPVTRGRRRLREGIWRTRGSRDLCPVCGYDLRASPERCPECGTVPTRGDTVTA